MKKFAILFLTIMLLGSCKKEEVEKEIQEVITYDDPTAIEFSMPDEEVLEKAYNKDYLSPADFTYE